MIFFNGNLPDRHGTGIAKLMAMEKNRQKQAEV
jgi:hypothetical protein